MKVIGSVFVIIGCAFCGFYCAYTYRNELALLRAFHMALEQIYAELQYKLSPLPILLRNVANSTDRRLSATLLALCQELDKQACPDVATCMNVVLERHRDLPASFRDSMCDLSFSLGKFDLSGQLQGLTLTIERLKEKIERMEADKTVNIQLSQTLGLCAGIGLAIILL